MNDLLFEDLLDKYLLEDITEEETRLFFGMLELPPCQERLLERIGKDLAERIYVQAEDHAKKDRIKIKLRLALPSGPEIQAVPMPGRLRLLRNRYAAAAILILLGLGSYWLFFNSHPGKRTGRTPLELSLNDIGPGGNKAILTLSNGQKIILDKAHIGQLASQGNTNIIKLDSGQLAYKLSVLNNDQPTAQNADPGTVLWNTLTTPRGGQYQLVLPDGTKVWLNASSSITYPTVFSGATRSVSISGEAYFEVARDFNRRFIVKAGPKDEIEVLGTHFNINAYADEPVWKTSLLEGAIRIHSARRYSAVLRPGDEAIHGNDQLAISHHSDTSEAIAWKTGYFQFGKASVHNIMNQVSRWYGLDVQYDGLSPDLYFHGKISRNTTAAEMLKILQASGLKYRIDKLKIIIIP